MDTEGAARKPILRLTAGALPWAGMALFGALWLNALRGAARGPAAGPAPAQPVQFEVRDPGRGRLARAPRAIPLRGWKDVLWRTWLEVGRDRLPAVAAGVTFYALLAVFPAVGAFVSLYGLFADVGEVSRQLGDLAAFVPPDVLKILGEQMVRLATARGSDLSVAFVVSLLLSVWSANAGVASLFDGLNIVYEEQEKRNFLVRRLLTYGFTFAALVFASAATAILVAAPIGLRLLGLGESLLVPLRWVLLLGLATAAFAVLYRYGPSREPARWRWVAPGAAAAAAAWVGGSLVFSWYVNNVAHYDVTYGSLGAVVGSMMWTWFSVMLLLLGAELNAEMEHQTAMDSTTGPPRPIGDRGAEMADTVGPAFGGVRRQAGLVWSAARRQVSRFRWGSEAAAARAPEPARIRPARPPGRPGGRPGPRRSAAR